MDDDEIEIDYGEDALQYLTFQRYIIGYLLFVMVLCLSVILPLNFTGSLQVSVVSFHIFFLVQNDMVFFSILGQRTRFWTYHSSKFKCRR